jgi:CubicO group peptidase (beta-lactamase class C family)
VVAATRRNTIRALAIIVSALLPCDLASQGQTPDQQIVDQVHSVLTRAVADGFGGAVVIERQGRTLLSAGYGLADRQSRRPFTPETIAPIGSITKTFTALAIVQLFVEGKVDLQRQLTTYLTSAREPAASARLHDLLTHQAGLPEYCGEDWARRTKAQLIAECTAQALTGKPGTLSYSNPGYSYLAAVVEDVSRQPWEGYLRDHVLAPASMARSGWLFPNRSGLDFARGYLNDKSNGMEVDRECGVEDGGEGDSGRDVTCGTRWANGNEDIAFQVARTRLGLRQRHPR